MPTTSPQPAITGLLAGLFAVLAPLNAQAPHAGNGFGAAFLESGVATIGGNYDVTWGSLNAQNGISIFCSSDGFGPMLFLGIGPVCLDFNSPAFYFDFFSLDSQGEASASLTVPNTPSLVGNAPIFGCVVVCENNGFSISKTVRIPYENAGAFQAVGAMNTPRALHTVTPLGADARDNETRVLIAGGGGGTVLQPLATDSTEVYVPLMRSYVAGPQMALERTLHRSVRLDNGKVLIIGGADSLGVVTDACELYDPATNSLSPTGAMTTPRVGHAATLLANGKVLVTGGLADYVDPSNNFIAVMNTAQDTAELYDPATGSWTAVPGTMVSKRSGHAQVTLQNGNLLIIGGIEGATTSTVVGLPVPVYTGTCSIYDPVANSMSQTGSLLSARGFLGASVLGNGNVLVTGGTISNLAFGIVSATNGCEVFDGLTWSIVATLPISLTNHVQVQGDNGDALIFGGLNGTFPNLVPVDTAGRHDGAAYTAGIAIGTNPGIPAALPQVIGAATAARLADGTWLLVGGSDATSPLTTTFIFHE